MTTSDERYRVDSTTSTAPAPPEPEVTEPTEPPSSSTTLTRVRDAVPGRGAVGEILGLADELHRVGRAGASLSRRIEEVTGLRAGELVVLAAVDHGDQHPRTIARSVGQIPEAAEATVDALVERGLLGRHAHESSTNGELALVHVTPRGAAAVEQAEAVQIRVADALAGALGHEQTRRLRATLGAVSLVLEAGAEAPLAS